MEISFNNQLLRDLYVGNKTTDKQFRSNPTLIKQYIKTVKKLESVNKVEQLFQFHGLNYEKLKGNLAGYSSVRINDQYRLIFEEIINKNEPFEVILFLLEEISKHYE
jgi:proteic killer suppression protein